MSDCASQPTSSCCSTGVCEADPTTKVSLSAPLIVPVAAGGCCSTGVCTKPKQLTVSPTPATAESPAPSGWGAVFGVDVPNGGYGSLDAGDEENAGCVGSDVKSCGSASRPSDGGFVFSLTWRQLALFMAWFSVFWNTGEGVSGVTIGIQHLQFAVLANAGQSGLEVLSAVLVLWRLQADAAGITDKAMILARERKGIRIMGFMFCALALGVIGGAIPRFLTKASPDDTLPGLIVSALAALAMIILYYLKRHASQRLNSSTLLEDANCSLMCFKLSCLVVLGSIIGLLQDRITDHCSSKFCDLWWIDATLACALSVLFFRDGVRVSARGPTARWIARAPFRALWRLTG